MSYESRKLDFNKEHIYIVEIDADYCGNTFSNSPCTATGSGDAKCYNTLDNCQDIPNFTKETKTYRFCEARSPHPIGLDAIPLLKSVNISPAVIDVGGGLGVRASVSCSFTDAPHSDIGIDNYVNERTYIASDRGTFWTKWRARNPNYQFRAMRVLSGYLVDGVYDAANFQTRYYVVETVNATTGACTVTGKDPLKLTSKNKAQAPIASKGLLSLPITSGATSLTLTPSGIGNAEYPASGKVLIKSEVMSFTRTNDVMTLTRAQNNTVATDHAVNSTVQLCLEYNSQSLDTIVKDLLENYAGIDSSFIPDSAWSAEVGTYLSGLLSGIIVKPFDVFKLLKELAEAMPHYLWWDERSGEIQLTALKAPPTGADVLDMDGNIVADSFSTSDEKDMRVSTVFVNFGQFDPTKKLDEPGNYEQTYIRIDTDSINKYSSNEIRTINSRWITNNNKAAALQLAALIGRRFSNIPRKVSFSLEAKDSDVWIGQTREVNHRDIVDSSGAPVNTLFQMLSAKESELYNYSALEFAYGPALPEDEGGGVPGVDLIIISIDSLNINLRTIYDSLFPVPSGSTQAKFIVEGGVRVGSSSTGSYGLDTGSWPAGATVTLQTNLNSLALGKGGKGSTATADDAENGGTAIILNHDLELVNNGIIGGGGGGGTRGALNVAAGGGGAGYEAGLKGSLNQSPPGTTLINVIAEDGTDELGGTGGRVDWEVGSEPFFDVGGNGGDLGQSGESKGGKTAGTAGAAINRNGFTLTQTVAGDIRGAIIG